MTTSSEGEDDWAVYGIPAFITAQVAPGDLVAFSMVYEPTEAQQDRWRISAVKVIGIGEEDGGDA